MRELRVLAREVSPQEIPAGVDEKRQVAHGEAALAQRDHGRKRVRLRLCEQRGAIGSRIASGQIHACLEVGGTRSWGGPSAPAAD